MAKSVLSRGLADGYAAAAASLMECSLSGFPMIARSDPAAAIGYEPTPPRTILASSTVPSLVVRNHVATPSTGKSNEPRRRSFQYVARQPLVGGRRISVSSSSGRLFRYLIPSSL